MRHARADYDRFQDPALLDESLLGEGSTPIDADEPVILIRGQDVAGPATVRFWADEHERGGGDPFMAEAARRHADAMEDWQIGRNAKVADAPAGSLR